MEYFVIWGGNSVNYNNKSARGLVIVVIVGVILMLSSVFLIAAVDAKPSKPPVTSPFTLETVDSLGNVGLYSQAAMDSSGALHVTYYDATNYALKYATNGGGSWHIETLAIIGSRYDPRWGGVASICVDTNDAVHVAYVGLDHSLYYTENSGGGWATHLVNSDCDVVGQMSMAVDVEGNVNICYFDNIDGDNPCVVYATDVGGSWAFTVIETSGNLAWHADIALDSAGYAFVTYSTFYDNKMRLVSNKDNWAIHIVDGGSFVQSGPSIAIDASDHIHLAYFTGNNNDGGTYVTDQQLTYAFNDGVWSDESDWQYTVISADTPDQYSHFVSLAVDKLGVPHISYNDISSSKPSARVTLNYATIVNSVWKLTQVDSLVDVHSSIAVDSNLRVFITYSNGDLKLVKSN